MGNKSRYPSVYRVFGMKLSRTIILIINFLGFKKLVER